MLLVILLLTQRNKYLCLL